VIEVRQTHEFAAWLEGLKDVRAADRIATRIRRMSLGNAGDVKPIGEGVSEAGSVAAPASGSISSSAATRSSSCFAAETSAPRTVTLRGRRRSPRRFDMPLETMKWDIQDYITTPERQLGYLEAVLEDGDPHLVAAALGDIAKARGISAIAEETGLSRMGLYKALSASGDPRLSTLLGVLRAIGLKLRIEPVQKPL
jgi:probable addiction module antidote protein